MRDDRPGSLTAVLKAVNLRARLFSNESNTSLQNSLWQKYHTLIHSGLLTEPLLALEHSFSVAVEKMISERDEATENVREHQTQEMEQMLARVGKPAGPGNSHIICEEDVNKLSVTHFAELDDLRKMWERSLAELKEQQLHEFNEWISKVYQQLQEQEQTRESSEERVRSQSQESERLSHPDDESQPKHLMDESFTINLGAQLKTTHNLRLLSAHVLDFCKNSSSVSLPLPSPQRIQTAMSLYSSSLCGLVLLVDNRVNSYSGLKAEFARLCERSTDFHFPSLSEQLEQVKRELESKSEAGYSLQVGDFYTTKHSNLSEVHVVFHLVADESVLSPEISSRHPVVMGLRNILRTAYLSEVCTICLPLLLVHEMSDHMTLQWCLRRAELVFKCVKGFMIEMASLTGGSETNRTLKFLLPEGIQEQLFSNLAAMLPSIFRLSNPLILSSN